jgi:hypothetical protein
MVNPIHFWRSEWARACQSVRRHGGSCPRIPPERGAEGHRTRLPRARALSAPDAGAARLEVNLSATELFRGKRARKEGESGTPTGIVRDSHVTEDGPAEAGHNYLSAIGVPTCCCEEPAFAASDYGGQPSPGLPTVARALHSASERRLAGSTGLEPAASGVTGRRSNQLNYDP